VFNAVILPWYIPCCHLTQLANLATYSSIEIGQQVHWCRGCFSDWGMNQWLCRTCFEDELKLEEQEKQELAEEPAKQQKISKVLKHKHDFVKTLIQETPNDPDTRKASVWCRTCEICTWSPSISFSSLRH
jgi:hypothetical protein